MQGVARHKKLRKCEVFVIVKFSLVKICATITMKKGFKNSIGCNLNKDKFNHLLAPFTSTPIIGTKTNSVKNIIKKGITVFFNKEVSKAEITNITESANMVKNKCFEKKK